MPEDRLLRPEEAAELETWFAEGDPSPREQWKEMYGFDNDCRCQQDYETGVMESVPLCLLETADLAFAALRVTRAVLYTIANSTTEDAEALKAFAAGAL